MAEFETNDLASGSETQANAAELSLEQGATRRDFFGRAIALASGVALTGFLPTQTMDAAPQATPPCHATAGQELMKLITIDRQPADNPNVPGTLECMVRMANEKRTVPLPTGTCGDPSSGTANIQMLRFFEGYPGQKIDPNTRVPREHGAAAPGPTLRARVGDTVKITFLNNINPNDFSGTDEFKGACDAASNATPPPVPPATTAPPDNNWLPKNDQSPDCFHGSNSGNLHFHGTHVTPNGFGDNILVQVIPYADRDPALRMKAFSKIFQGDPYSPAHWQMEVPPEWQKEQLGEKGRLPAFDKVNGLTGAKSLTKADDDLIAQGLWPSYQAGAFPHFFKVTKSDGQKKFEMDQCPGTHWYHAHKHGSTAMHLLNGLAGVFIIEGKYDDDLTAWNAKVKQTERIIILQEFADMPNLYRTALPRALLVNGGFQPNVTMNQGEIQLLRIVNAAQQAPYTIDFTAAPFKVRQIAQDGVQLNPANYTSQVNGKFTLSPGNRIDILVQAPTSSATFPVLYNGGAATGGGTLFTLATTNTTENPPMTLPVYNTDPKINTYPIFPTFLKDIDPATIRIYRRLTFNWDANHIGRSGPNHSPPKFMIDGKQFQDDVIDHTMYLGDSEEWLLENASGIPHPFHIHVNPFQVVEVLDPNTQVGGAPVIGAADYPLFTSSNLTLQQKERKFALMQACMAPIQAPFVWWDTIAIPAALTDANGNLVLMGHVTVRHRFVDFTGLYVLHCHILGHEDRGMMQLVQVTLPPKTAIKHGH